MDIKSNSFVNNRDKFFECKSSYVLYVLRIFECIANCKL